MPLHNIREHTTPSQKKHLERLGDKKYKSSHGQELECVRKPSLSVAGFIPSFSTRPRHQPDTISGRGPPSDLECLHECKGHDNISGYLSKFGTDPHILLRETCHLSIPQQRKDPGIVDTGM